MMRWLAQKALPGTHKDHTRFEKQFFFPLPIAYVSNWMQL